MSVQGPSVAGVDVGYTCLGIQTRLAQTATIESVGMMLNSRLHLIIHLWKLNSLLIIHLSRCWKSCWGQSEVVLEQKKNFMNSK